MRRIFIIITILVFSTLTASANLPVGIAKGFKNGDANTISKYFGNTLEISITGAKSMYSKVQATQVLSNFFASSKPSGFVEKHSGGRGASQFSVVTFKGGGQAYRATILYKGNGETARISQITIEKDSGF